MASRVYRVRNWATYQHYNHRRPPWVKLYRDLLECPEWAALPAPSAKLLIGFWLVASDCPKGEGTLPDSRTLAFRLRTTEKQIEQALSDCSHWLAVSNASSALAGSLQGATPERETETETETENTCSTGQPKLSTGENLDKESDKQSDSDGFTEFWAAYPRHEARKRAETAWRRLPKKDKRTALKSLPSWPFSDEPRYIPLPATWINQRRWEDEPKKSNGAAKLSEGSLWKMNKEGRSSEILRIAEKYGVSTYGKENARLFADIIRASRQEGE